MAMIRCPQACRWISQVGNVTFENRDVTIFSDICSHSDRCGMEDCQYFDNSEEATRKFIQAQALSHGTVQDQEKARHYERMLRVRHGQKMPR